MKSKVVVVVVTYNRKTLLQSCLGALIGQTLQPERILVVDNASDDGTRQMLSDEGLLDHDNLELLALDDNTGGAGGFKIGLERATSTDGDWVWMMDDDAEPHLTALAELMKIATNPANVYGSVATHGDEISWATTLLEPKEHVVNHVAQVPDKAEVQSLPFLGFLIHTELVRTIGLPDEGFFIAADDIEYCVRAKRAGAKIIIAGRSHIEHPKTHVRTWQFLGMRIAYLSLAPWKRYYDTRNRLLIARKYYSFRLLTQTIPGSFVRLFAALCYEPRKMAQLWAFCTGMFDGLVGIKGRRHAKWGIRQ